MPDKKNLTHQNALFQENPAEQAFLEQIFDHHHDAILVLGKAHEILYINEATKGLLEAEKPELIGEIFPFEVQRDEVSELEIPASGDRMHTVELTAFDLIWQGEVARVVILRKTAPTPQVEQTENTNTDNRDDCLLQIALLTGGIAHDFNNMLTAVVGNIDLALTEGGLSEQLTRRLRAAESAALQAKVLSQQLMSLSRGGSIVLQPASAGEIVRECAQFTLRGSNVKCEMSEDAGLWPIDADKGQISQVVSNLILNANQAMPNGGTVQLRMRNLSIRRAEVPGLKPGDYVCIEVKDTGIGVPDNIIKKIFEPYFTTKAEGNGLGLPSSLAIAKNHKGTITADSAPGCGSAFRFYLPRGMNPPPTVQKTEETSRQNTPTNEIFDPGCGHILVMDDMEAMMTVAGEILNLLGYTVEYSSNGEEAIVAYKAAKESNQPFDAVVFDLTVPGGMGGEEAANILKAYDPDLKAIASSGYSHSNIMSNCQGSAFQAVVPKPYRIKEMRDALHSVLQKTNAG